MSCMSERLSGQTACVLATTGWCETSALEKGVLKQALTVVMNMMCSKSTKHCLTTERFASP